MIGLCAQSRMGKDTVAAVMMDIKPNYCTTAFGNELKHLISNYFDIELHEIEEYKTSTNIHPNIEVNMRKTLQLIGEAMRQISPEVREKNALKNMKKSTCIFTDVRYENEMQSILDKKGFLILLGRSKYLNRDPHPSESGLQYAIEWFLENTNESFIIVENMQVPDEFKKFSYFLRNDGSLDDLRKNIHRLCKDMDKKPILK